MRFRDFVILWLVVAVALFVLIPESRVVAQFVWDSYIAGPEYIESDDAVVLTSSALIVSWMAYLPYVWLALGVLGLLTYVVRSRRSA
jgi:hypothetical protein